MARRTKKPSAPIDTLPADHPEILRAREYGFNEGFRAAERININREAEAGKKRRQREAADTAEGILAPWPDHAVYVAVDAKDGGANTRHLRPADLKRLALCYLELLKGRVSAPLADEDELQD